MSFSREQIEHAYTSTRRLRARLSALAGLVAPHTHVDQVACVAREAVNVLDVRACIFQRYNSEKKLETIALHKHDDLTSHELEKIATRVVIDADVAQGTVAINNLAMRYPGESWLDKVGVNSYLGLPLYATKNEVIGVASVIGSAARQFNEEDEWWLKTAAQLVADTVAYKLQEAKLRKLEQLLGPPENSSKESNSKQSENNKLSVLVIDDDRAFNDILCEFLTLEGHRVEAAFDGVEAMRMFRPAEHNVVMSDVAMPHMNGWELIAALRVRAPEIPVVLITGYGSGNWNESYLRKQGVVAVLSKPLDMTHLANILRGIALRNQQTPAH